MTNLPQNIPTSMQGVYLTGHGGFDKLEFRDDIPVPQPADYEVLIRVGAAGVNNTDINTRVGWYSKKVQQGTNSGGDGFREVADDDGAWGGALAFPRIQGADCCGVIVAVGEAVAASQIGERVLVRTMQAGRDGARTYTSVCTGSERDGAFAQYMTAESIHSLKIDSSWSDIELASVPCAYSTAEGLLHRSAVEAETVLITGASGGVGSAAVQLARRRGAKVIAVAAAAKAGAVRALGADRVLDRNASLIESLGPDSVDVVIDLVAGETWPQLLEILRRGGRYATSGAIAGPLVELDVRTLYLKDLTLYGCTYQEDIIFENLIKYIEAGEIKPTVAKSYPLADIVRAQQDFLDKKFVGKLVLVPAQNRL